MRLIASQENHRRAEIGFGSKDQELIEDAAPTARIEKFFLDMPAVSER